MIDAQVASIALGDDTEVIRYISRAYSTSPPEVYGSELMSDSLKAIYDKLWNQSAAPTAVTCHMLREATVEGPGLVFDSLGRLVLDTVQQSSAEEIHAAKNLVESTVGLQTTPGVTLLVEKAGIGNYGHWLVEMLPRAFLNRRFLQPLGWRVRTPAMSEDMEAVAHDSLSLLGIPDTQMIRRPPGPARYEQLILVKGLTNHGLNYSPLTIDCLEFVAESIEVASQAKLWFSRAGAVRSLVDEEAVCAVLAREGWKIVQPGQLSLSEQIALSKGALEIAGVAGAGMTNLAFAPRGIKVTAFMPAEMPDVFFWMLSGFKQQHYREVRCSHVMGKAGSAPWEAPLQITTREVVARLLD